MSCSSVIFCARHCIWGAAIEVFPKCELAVTGSTTSLMKAVVRKVEEVCCRHQRKENQAPGSRKLREPARKGVTWTGHWWQEGQHPQPHFEEVEASGQWFLLSCVLSLTIGYQWPWLWQWWCWCWPQWWHLKANFKQASTCIIIINPVLQNFCK